MKLIAKEIIAQYDLITENINKMIVRRLKHRGIDQKYAVASRTDTDKYRILKYDKYVVVYILLMNRDLFDDKAPYIGKKVPAKDLLAKLDLDCEDTIFVVDNYYIKRFYSELTIKSQVFDTQNFIIDKYSNFGIQSVQECTPEMLQALVTVRIDQNQLSPLYSNDPLIAYFGIKSNTIILIVLVDGSHNYFRVIEEQSDNEYVMTIQ